MKLFTCETNYDLTEGRGWEVPTVFTLTLNDALYFAHTHRLFYERPQSINEREFGDFGFEHSKRVSFEWRFEDEILGSDWRDYVDQLEERGEVLPKPGAAPQAVYIVGGSVGRMIGSTRYPDVFAPRSAFTDEAEAIEAAQKMLPVANEETLYVHPRVFKLFTNTPYGVRLFDGEPHYVAVKPETVNRKEARFAELKRRFEVSNG